MERNKYIDSILSKKQRGNYDCAVMFSGGKDSTYLLYLFKEVYKKNVIAVTVDNGFEFEATFEQGKKITDRLGVPYHIISPGKENFRLFFESAIKEPELFNDVKHLNHLCLVCSKLLWGIVASYASQNNIPFVIGGYDPAQLYDIEEINEFTNGIKEKVDKLFLAKLKKMVENTANYKTNEEYRNFIESCLCIPKNIQTIFPFIYIDYNVDMMKSTLAREIDWHPPLGIGLDQYLTSGCKIIYLLFEIEKFDIVNTIERKSVSKLINDGSVDKSFEGWGGEVNRVIRFGHEIYDELDVRKTLIEKCKEMGIDYVE